MDVQLRDKGEEVTLTKSHTHVSETSWNPGIPLKLMISTDIS